MISVFSNMSRPVEGITQPPIQRKSGVKSTERKAELHRVMLRMNGAIPLLPIMPSGREQAPPILRYYLQNYTAS